MKKTNKNSNIEKNAVSEVTADSIGVLAEKILDEALCLIDKRLTFASDNKDTLDELTEYVESLEKDEMTRTQKNSLIQKINDLKLNKLSEITSIVTMCKDKLNANNDVKDASIVFKIDYGDVIDEIMIEEGLNGD